MPKILKEEILKAEDKDFSSTSWITSAFPTSLRWKRRRATEVGRMAGSRSAAASRTATGGWKSVSSLQHPRWRARPLCLRSQSLPEMQRRAHKVHGSEQRRTPDHQPVVVSSENTESSQQRPLQLKMRFIIRRRQRASNPGAGRTVSGADR